MKKLLIISTLLFLVSCGSKGNKENHGSGVTVTPWCADSYIDERNDIVSDINMKLRMWDFRASLNLPIEREEVEDLLTRTAKFLNAHEDTVCRGNVMETCDVLNNFNCRFEFKEEVVNNNLLVDLRNKMVEILAGADE